jgi:hypothetical protein
MNDLWLDEIWSLHFAESVHSPLDVFTKIHHDGNHYLNTLCIHFLGRHGNWPGYRIPAIIAGLVSVVLAGVIGYRRNVTSGYFCMVLVAFSYVQILYSSEARGYASVVCLSLLCFLLMDIYLQNHLWWIGLIFSLCAILGFMSHLVFGPFFLSMLLWSAYHLLKTKTPRKPTSVALLLCYGAPVAFLVVLYFIDIRHMETAVGTHMGLLHGYGSSLGWAMGIRSPNFLLPLTDGVACVLLALGVQTLRREKSDSFVLFIGSIVVMPLLAGWAWHGQGYYVRYFIIGIAFLLILFGFILADLWSWGRQRRTVSCLLLAFYLAANGWHTLRLFQHGRGHNAEMVRYLADNTNGLVTTIGSDSDSRFSKILQFNEPEFDPSKTGTYYSRGQWPSNGVEWLVYHRDSFEDPVSPGAQVTDGKGNLYDLVNTFPTAPLSGFHWFIYHRRAKTA